MIINHKREVFVEGVRRCQGLAVMRMQRELAHIGPYTHHWLDRQNSAQ